MKKLYLLIAMLFAMAAMLPQRMNAQTIPVWDGAYTTWTQGSGTQTDPYLIEIPQHLAWLAQKVNDGTSTYNGVYFRLTADLDMNSLEWTPIGNSTTNRFKGVFDGDGHFIDNIYAVNRYNSATHSFSNPTYCGLFGVIEDATIVNLGVNTTVDCQSDDGNIIPSVKYAGGIVAYVNSGNNTITNCYNNGNITINSVGVATDNYNNHNRYYGGLIGCIGGGGNTTITECHNYGNVRGLGTYKYGYGNPNQCFDAYCGGICGLVEASTYFTNCYNSGVIVSVNPFGDYVQVGGSAGGLLGRISNGTITINNSHSDGNVNGELYGGGLVGSSSTQLNISNCYNTANIQGGYAGGLVAYSTNGITMTYSRNTGLVQGSYACGGLICKISSGSITHCFNKGNVTTSNAYYGGGIIGETEASIILVEQCFNSGSISAQCNYCVGGIIGVVNTGSSATVKECYNVGSTWAIWISGGIIGRVMGASSINNCYNSGSLTTDGGAIIGMNDGGGIISNCYYLETCGGNAQTGAISKTSSQMQSPFFPGILNEPLSPVVVYVQDVSPYVNQGYPIFGDLVYAVSTQAATNVGVTKATLHGTYAGGADVAAFQYRENTTGSDWTTVNANIGSPVAYLLTGLQSNTTYIYRFMVQKNGGSYYGEEMSFTTGTCNLTASVTPSSVNICEGVSTTLTASAQSSLGNFFTYSWNTGAATSNLNVSNGGIYTVTVSDTNGCLATASANVVAHPQPVVGISGDTYLCMGQSGTLTATGGNTYAWSTGATTPSIPVSHGGTYSVTATNSYGCSGSASVTVTSLENLSIAGNTSFCNGQSTTLSVANGTGSYLWSTGATTSSIPVSQAGLYTVTVTLPNGCTSSVSASVSVAPTPVPTILGNTTICQNQTTTLTANGGVSYIWSNGSTTNSITVSQSGVYAVTATNAEGCSASTNVTITVNPLPNVNITGNSSFCQGDNTTLTATGASTYAWSNSSTVDAITVNAAGTYTVTGTDANGCTNTATKTVSVNPIYNIPLSHSICQGESYNFHGQNLTTAGTYTHTLQTVKGCDSILTLTLSVKPLPTPSISGNTSVCEGQSTTLTANGGNSYVWSNGSTNNNISVSQSGIYTVIATNAEGCSATANVTVSVNPLPNVSINGNTTICQGSNTTLIANGADSYSWSTGENTASINVSAFGIYTVTGTSAAGCSNTATATVIVSQAPVITITGNTELCEGETTTLTANGGSSYLWSNGTTGANLSVNIAGTYQVIGYNDAGCNTMAETTVHVWQPATSEFTITTTENCYEWNGQSYCQSGDYTQTLQTIHGCDSVVTLHLTITVGIDDYDFANAMMLYPNPTSDLVNVQLTMNNEQLEEIGIQVFDVYGRLLNIVETGRAPSPQTMQINLSQYAKGVYFVKAVSEGKVIAVRKVVKR